MFESFPKKRPFVDPEKLKRLYDNYEANRQGKTAASRLSGYMERWMHKMIAADVRQDFAKITLEIGAGNLNHLLFEKTLNYDIVEPWTKLWENSPYLNRVRNIYNDINDIPLTRNYDRIISIATFEHLTYLPQVIALSCLHLNPGGCLRVGIPNEGSWVWKTCWRLTTGLEYFLKTGEDYGLIMKHEHINSADEIEEILKFFFEIVKVKYFGITKSISIYRYYECYEPKKDKASLFLGNSL